MNSNHLNLLDVVKGTGGGGGGRFWETSHSALPTPRLTLTEDHLNMNVFFPSCAINWIVTKAKL